jgi:ring-1,2-phenylacetyl-CoA epoxidase subunit PaaA
MRGANVTILDDSIELDDIPRMPSDYVETLVHQLAANGEGELSAGDTYIDSFNPLAPNADERYTCIKFAMEEMDHYRRFARLLRDLGHDVGHMVHQPKSERTYFPADSMTVKFERWEERAAFSFLCELEGHFQINEMVTSTYAPLRREAAVILREEAAHFAHGAKLMKMAAEKSDTLAAAQAAVNRFYPMALDMFGRSASRRSETAVRWGLRRLTNSELRERYKVEISTHLTRLGYDVPVDDPSKRRFL